MKKITAVVAAPDTFREVEVLLRTLHRQTARERMTILVACPSLSRFDPPGDLDEIAGEVELLEAGEGVSLEGMRVAGVRASTTRYVALPEDHCFPEPRWFEDVIARLDEGWAGVGSAIAPANPASTVAQAVYLLGYGEFGPPVASGERDFIPGHNSAFSRPALMDLEPDLDDHFAMKSVMMRTLRQRGHRFFMEGGVVAWHFDFHTRPLAILGFWRHFGRLLGSQRGRSWPYALRLLAGAGWPALWAARIWRALQAYRRVASANGLRPACLVHVPVLTLCWAVGEWIGLWAGPGRAQERVECWEHDRTRHVDRVEWDARTRRILTTGTA